MALMARLVGGDLVVGQPCDLEILLTCSHDLAPGDTVEVQFPNSWCLVTGPSYTRPLQTLNPEGPHYIQVWSSEAEFEVDVRPRHLNCAEGVVRHGRHIVATIVEGQVRAGSEIAVRYRNTVASNRSETETVWIRVKGEAPDIPPVLTVRPGPEVRIRVLVPSRARPGEEFTVHIVSLDEWDNASSARYEDEYLSLARGGILREAISFTGATSVGASLAEPGVYRIRFGNTLSNPIEICEQKPKVYWGDLHIHTKLSHDAQGTDPYTYARDVSGLDVAAVADHCNSLGPLGYGQVIEWAEAANVDGEFVTILADEREASSFGGPGHYNAYFRSLEAFRRHVAEPEGVCRDPLAEGDELAPEEVMFIPHHTGICFGGRPEPSVAGSRVEWDAWDDETLRPAVEIYSHHGQSEAFAPQHALAYEMNRMRRPERRANTSVPGPYYAQNYWMAGKRIGAIASSDEHSGQGGRRHGGVAAIMAHDLRRDDVFDAIRDRRTYATTGERVLVDFHVGQWSVGEEGAVERGSTLPLKLTVHGTTKLILVEILRHRFDEDGEFVPIVAVPPRPESMDYSVEIGDTIEGPTVYYARITQEPLGWPDMAWTSPIWIDVME
ncbi:MAG: DUF3604 domain-containing protein [Armatimonadia bacterium]|nr:DUF3604 domain-containing protein [Armatimonadia bacterium]